MWSARRLSITTTTTFIAPTGARPSLTSCPAAVSSLSQAAALISVRPAAPAPPARSTSRRVSSSAKVRYAPRLEMSIERIACSSGSLSSTSRTIWWTSRSS